MKNPSTKMIAWINRTIVKIKEGDAKALLEAKDWLAYAASNGNPGDICRLLRGCQLTEEEDEERHTGE